MSMKASLVGLVVILCLVLSESRAQSTVPTDVPPEVLAWPDLVLHGGKILTVDEQFSVAQALAIRDGRFLAVGDNSRILKMSGPATQKIDLQGKTVVPGFIDTHFHLGDYAFRYMLLEEKGIQWEGRIDSMGIVSEDAEMVLREVRRGVRASSPGELVALVVYGQRALAQVKRREFDAISPQNPVIIYAHAQIRPLAADTQAIQKFGLAEANSWTSPDGILVTAQAVPSLSLRVTMEKNIEWQRKAMRLVNSWGMVQVDTRITPDHFNAIREIWLKDELTVRWRVGFPGPLSISNTGNVSDIGDDWLRISGAGGGFVPGSRAAFGHWSTQVPVTAEEVSGWPQGRRELVETLRYGWSIPNSHIKGNIAVRAVLDAMEEALQDPIVRSSNQRLTMDHMEDLSPEDLDRVRRLGVIPSNMPRDIFHDGHQGGASDYLAVFGADAVNRMLPLKEYLRRGVRPTIEADTPDYEIGRPLWTIEKAVCRCVDGMPRVWGADQKVSRQEALRMKTIYSAAYTGDQHKQGSIEAGKLADLVVLDGDYLSVPEDKISDLEAVMTIVGGRIVYGEENQ